MYLLCQFVYLDDGIYMSKRRVMLVDSGESCFYFPGFGGCIAIVDIVVIMVSCNDVLVEKSVTDWTLVSDVHGATVGAKVIYTIRADAMVTCFKTLYKFFIGAHVA